MRVVLHLHVSSPPQKGSDDLILSVSVTDIIQRNVDHGVHPDFCSLLEALNVTMSSSLGRPYFQYDCFGGSVLVRNGSTHNATRVVYVCEAPVVKIHRD